jgi:hypothetical protein
MADLSLRGGSASRNEFMIVALAENWWAIAIRGGLGILFGMVALFLPGATMLSLVLLFAAYAFCRRHIWNRQRGASRARRSALGPACVGRAGEYRHCRHRRVVARNYGDCFRPPHCRLGDFVGGSDARGGISSWERRWALVACSGRPRVPDLRCVAGRGADDWSSSADLVARRLRTGFRCRADRAGIQAEGASGKNSARLNAAPDIAKRI